jgi:hypothetical protein
MREFDSSIVEWFWHSVMHAPPILAVFAGTHERAQELSSDAAILIPAAHIAHAVVIELTQQQHSAR